MISNINFKNFLLLAVFSSWLFYALFFSAALQVFAACTTNADGTISCDTPGEVPSGATNCTSNATGGVTCGTAGSTGNNSGSQGQGTSRVTIDPPFSGTLLQVLERIANFLILIGAPIATIMILYGAFQILTAGAKSEQFTKGKNTIIYAAVGYGIIIIARGITSIVVDLITG
ncbi:MAG: hypothetical protein HYT12_01465 [Candidatus Liptonbacteria bacterium]|nr:hypothetical protein [Candidatus Liptonbacteria bacterium]